MFPSKPLRITQRFNDTDGSNSNGSFIRWYQARLYDAYKQHQKCIARVTLINAEFVKVIKY